MVYMLDRLIEAIDNLYRKDIVEVLGGPVLLRRRFDLDNRGGPFAAAQAAAAGLQSGFGLRQKFRRNVTMDQKRLSSVADGHVLALGIDGDINRHLQIGVTSDIDVTYSVGVAEDGYVRIAHDVADEFVGAAGDDQVDVFVLGEHFGDVLARLQELEPTGGQAGPVGGFGDYRGEDAVGFGRFAAAFEQDGVAAFETERGDLHECVRAGFEDDADDADGAGDFVEFEAGVELGRGDCAADGVGQCGELFDAGDGLGDFGFVELQAFE